VSRERAGEWVGAGGAVKDGIVANVLVAVVCLEEAIDASSLQLSELVCITSILVSCVLSSNSLFGQISVEFQHSSTLRLQIRDLTLVGWHCPHE